MMAGLHALSARVSRASLLRQTSWKLKQSRFSTSARHSSYADTLPNLKIGAHTRVLYQGFTGRFFVYSVVEELDLWY